MAAVGLTTVLLVAVALFIVFLVARTFGLRVCAACAAFASVWVGLLALSTRGVDVDPLLIGILMGGSAVGLTYLLKEKLPEAYQLFTLPLLATLFSLVYLVLGGPSEKSVYSVLAALWLLFGMIFFVRENPAMAHIAKKLIECCKNW